MKTLQNNFTTPEQSKRLMELGVPADSADCVRVVRTNMVFFMQHGKVTKDYLSLYKSARSEEAEPCWSVGRLIEILCKCGIHYVDDGNLVFNFKQGRLNDIVGAFVDALEYNCKDGCIDFSKLEE